MTSKHSSGCTFSSDDTTYCYTEDELRLIALDMLKGDHCDSVLSVMFTKEVIYKSKIKDVELANSLLQQNMVSQGDVINQQWSQIDGLRKDVKQQKRQTYGVSVLCAVICGVVIFLSVP